jgi:hypothetical protein
MLRQIGGFLGRVEISHLLYIQSVLTQVKSGQGCPAMIAPRQLGTDPL